MIVSVLFIVSENMNSGRVTLKYYKRGGQNRQKTYANALKQFMQKGREKGEEEEGQIFRSFQRARRFQDEQKRRKRKRRRENGE